MPNNKGIVYLVGAGPGDIGLLTIKGLKCLKRADVVVYDFHLNAQVLNYIRHDAEFIYAGKRGGHHTMTQDQINDVLVEKAKEGKRVCRLKGGDPFVFGRGGEEAEALVKEGLAFEVVPGVSSSISAPAYAGIPLTHRRVSSSFAVVPGYEDMTRKDTSAIDWAKLATGVGTLVFLMAVKNISELMNKLIEHGRPIDTPVAVVRWGTRADQRTLISTLGRIVEDVKDNDIKPPAVMVVGEVVNLRQTLNWFELKPMFGHRVLVTREHAGGFDVLEDLGAEMLEFPTIRIVPPTSWAGLDAAIRGIEDNTARPDWAVFTSANGVKFFFERLNELGGDIRDLRGISVCAIGEKTALKLRSMGLRVDMVPEEFNAEGLTEAFLKKLGRDELKGMRFLLPRAEEAREVFPDAVRALGGHMDVVTAYKAALPERHPRRLKRFLREGRISIATFTSAATFRNFITLMDEGLEPLRDVTIAAIGPVTKRAIEKAGLTVAIMPEVATVEAMVEAIRVWATTDGKNKVL